MMEKMTDDNYLWHRQPVPKFRSARRELEPRLVVKTTKKRMKVEAKTGPKLSSGPFRLMARKRFFHDLPSRPIAIDEVFVDFLGWHRNWSTLTLPQYSFFLACKVTYWFQIIKAKTTPASCLREKHNWISFTISSFSARRPNKEPDPSKKLEGGHFWSYPMQTNIVKFAIR